MKYLIILSALIIQLYAINIHAEECTIQCPVTSPEIAWAHFQDDHFRWTDTQQQVHMLIGFSGTLVVSELLTRYTYLKPWQSALIGTVALGLVGVTKEVMFDAYTSRSDIMGWFGGAAAGGLTFIVIHF